MTRMTGFPLFDRTARAIAACAARGHDFGSGPFAPGHYLHFCRRGCGAELLGRPLTAIDNLAPLDDDVRDLFDHYEEVQYEGR